MCGRFENKKMDNNVVELLQEKGLKVRVEKKKVKRVEEDIRPTQKILSIFRNDDEYLIDKINWGIKFGKDSPLIFNSRIETIKEKKYWKALLESNKCIVPMTGFYEWKKEGSGKTKYRIFLPKEDTFFVPALYYRDKEENIFASLITTVQNNFIKQIHHRMPIIFDLREAVNFLNDTVEKNLASCVPYNNNKKMEMEKIV